MLPEVDDRIGVPHRVEPSVERHVVVGGRQVGGVVHRYRVVAVAAGRLDGDEHIAELDAAEHERAVVHPVDAGGLTPRVLHLGLRVCWQGAEPRDVVLGAHTTDGLGELGRRERLGVVGEAVGQAGHQRVAIGRELADPVARGGERFEQADGARRCVEANGVPQPAALRRIGAEDDHDAALGRRAVP